MSESLRSTAPIQSSGAPSRSASGWAAKKISRNSSGEKDATL